MTRGVRRAATGLAGLALAVSVLAAGLWVWSGTSGSLTTAVQLATAFVPGLLGPGQSLQVEGAQGVLREGGSLRLLRWTDGTKTVEAHDAALAWDWRALASGELRLARLHVRLLQIDAPGESAEPLQALQLPLRLDLQFAIDTLVVQRPTALQITGLQGSYQYDGQTHLWNVTSAQVASGRYTTQGRMQGAAPMAVSAQAGGTVSMQVPNSRQAVDLQAQASVQGTLSGMAASLDVSGDLRTARDTTQPHAQFEAQIHPWQLQPVVRAHARWSALDLAALWPQAPQTALAGDLSVVPIGSDWKAQLRLQNATPGPINQQRLPLQSAQALVVYRDGQWVVQSLQAQGAGGTLQAQGRFSGGTGTSLAVTSAWSATASLSAINPALVDTRLAPLALTGTATAQPVPQGIGFALQLQTAAQAPMPVAKPQVLMRLKSVEAKGVWSAPVVQFDAVTVQAQDATLQGRLRVNTRTLAADGQLNASAPGLTSTIDGALSATDGQGNANVQLQDAAAATQWLSRLPGWAAADAQRLAELRVLGTASLSARWQGGWQQQGKAMRLDAQINSSRLDVARADTTAPGVRLSGVQADLSGNLQALVLNLRGQADVGEQAFALQARAHGGRLAEGRWDASLDTAQFTARSTLREGDWNLRLARSVALQWRQTATLSALDVAGGTLELAGPVPGAAQIAWQPVAWSHKSTASGLPPFDAVWQTRGSVQGLPLAWLEILGQTRISNLGLRGDLVFGGQWEASGSKDLAVRAMLERTSGDLQLLSDAARDGLSAQSLQTLRAGLLQARMDVQINQNNASAKLLWNSDNAGSASADFSTRLQREGGGWTWAADAPVAAQVRANLPRVGVWSLLAPPGWRIQGTLDADTRLSGTRSDPQWSGTLLARDLSVRSVVDGIDFSQGQLRVRLNGQRLEIEDFSLQGAGGAGGGQLTATGSVLWLAAPARVRVELNAVAQALRVSARADQRLVVSGKLSGRLEDDRLTVRGALVADQAQFVLPEDSAPRLGADVVVRPVARTKAPAGPVKAAAPRKPLALDIEISLDPGNNFQLSGNGLRTRLAGLVKLTTDPGGASLTPRLRGELRTVGGSYKAYGQALDITQGVLRFSGPYDNPTLDILALRPNLQQQVGVQISGTAQLPKVRLYADPDLPEAEKLSWLMLGRAPTAGGGGGADNALFQRAAMALLSGSGPSPAGDFMGAFGLDEMSVGETNTTNADGTNGATATTVKLGKRLSRDFYVAYERSIASTLGTFYVFYDLSRRFTLRAESGAHSAIDLIFTTRFD